MTVECLELLGILLKDVEDANDMLIRAMSDKFPNYMDACIYKSYEDYFQALSVWNGHINEYLTRPQKCATKLGRIKQIYDMIDTPFIKNYVASDTEASDSKKTLGKDDLVKYIEDIALAGARSYVLDAPKPFKLSRDLSTTMIDLANIFVNGCECQLADIFKMLAIKYRARYAARFENKTNREINDIIRSDFNNFVSIIKSYVYDGVAEIDGAPNPSHGNLVEAISNQLTGLFSFSVESELNSLIPNELGSMKEFFVKIISKYYNELHPVIWAQMFRGIVDNIFITMPFTPDEIFSFFSKHFLLNSGPFILKILQMIRPVLSPELATKYNLTKLTYPLMRKDQVEYILSKTLLQPSRYEPTQNYSASVGHVVKCIDNKDGTIVMIKIIKPLAITQSCWEYSALKNVYPEGSCEQKFINSMLESNAHEFNVKHEMNNLIQGHKLYTASYNDVFSHDIDAHLTTIEYIPHVVREECWFVLAMSLAPGVPLSSLTESNALENDTIYRSQLHRCLDILVSKFFSNIISNGFYHGDLHAGNIFFSFEQSQITLIDFGAVGEIDLFENSADTKALLSIMIASVYHNFPFILDTLTELLNSKCDGNDKIDTSNDKYKKLRKALEIYQEVNIASAKLDKQNTSDYRTYIFGDNRIHEEKQRYELATTRPACDTIYCKLDMVEANDTILESRDTLQPFKKKHSTSSKSFNEILEIIIKYYATSGVNIAVKINEFYEFQKAYALLLGVLANTHYSSYRMGIAIEKGIKSWKNVAKAIGNPSSMMYVINQLREQKSIYDKIKDNIKQLDATST